MNLKKNLINTKLKKLGAAIGILSFVVIIGLYSNYNNPDISEPPEQPKPVSISDSKNQNAPNSLKPNGLSSIESDAVEISDEQLNLKGCDFEELNESEDLQELFKDSIINKHTINVIKMIQKRFNFSFNDINSHYKKVEEFLGTQFDDEAKVEDFYNFYKKYNEFEMAQINDSNSLWLKTPENPEEAISLTNEKQQYQREVFGYDVADTLWDEETKIHEYNMKILGILREDIYSAQVKEQLIEELKAETFGDNGGERDTIENLKARLYVKLAIHSEDLMDMTDEERDRKIDEFKNEIFSPEELKFINFFEGMVETDSEETMSGDS